MSYNTAPERLTKGGIANLEDSLQTAHSCLSQIFEQLGQADARLFAPKPRPAGGLVDDGAKPTSVENSINYLVTRLRELETLTAAILHG